jgi:hypothetical protein
LKVVQDSSYSIIAWVQSNLISPSPNIPVHKHAVSSLQDAVQVKISAGATSRISLVKDMVKNSKAAVNFDDNIKTRLTNAEFNKLSA